MKVVEKFVSINGEGTRAGELAVFIRFKGCNLRCTYCDTMWANEAGCDFTEMTPAEIHAYIRETGVKNVTLTGGEPLLQPEMPELLRELMADESLRVEIETNGAVAIEDFAKLRQELPARFTFTMDYKLPSSGCESGMKLENMQFLESDDTVKFVSGSMEDLDRAWELIQEYHLTERCHAYLSPIFGAIEPKDMVDYMMAHNMNDVRLQIQMHKVIWDPNERGV